MAAADLSAAVARHRAGRLAEAEKLYRDHLAAAPDDVLALHNLGVIANERGDHAVAAQLLGRAVDLRPRFTSGHAHLGDALTALGRYDEAEASFCRALALAPNSLDALAGLAGLHKRAGRRAEAVGLWQAAVAAAPDRIELLHNLGLALADAGRLDQGIETIEAALQKKTDFATGHSNLCALLRRANRLQESIAAGSRAIVLAPEDAIAHYNLAMALSDSGDRQGAIAGLERSVILRPAYADALNALGLIHRDLGRPTAALAYFRRAVSAGPIDIDLIANLGALLQETGRFGEAIELYRSSLRRFPGCARLLADLGEALQQSGALPEAVDCFEQALAAGHPEAGLCLCRLIHYSRQLCRWDAPPARNLRAMLRERPSADNLPHVFFAIDSTPGEQLAAARAHASRVEAGLPLLPYRRPKPSGRIRLGYLSADFRQHAMGTLLAELFALHDRHEFEVFGYSMAADDGSNLARRIRDGFDQCVEVSGVPGDSVANQIHAAGVDILVDLMGYTRGARSDILARRPAPIQVNYLGYPGTMGASFIDYIIVDGIVVPSARQPFFSERLVQLPHSYQANDRQRAIGPMPNKEACGLPAKGFVFCCFNNSFKIGPSQFDIWMRLLREVRGSVLWLLAGHAEMEANLRRIAADQGIEASRLVFAPRRPAGEHLARHRLADLFLDTLPYNAHTTASDALWAGLPLVTCKGETFASCVAASLLQSVGLPDLITENLDDYFALALRLATDPPALSALKTRLGTGRARAPLFDTPRFVRDLERAYFEMRRLAASGEPPRSIRIDP